MIAQTSLQQGSDVVKVVDIMDHFINCIHYDVDVLSVYLGGISCDIENRHNMYYSFLLCCLCCNELIHSFLDAVNVLSSGSYCKPV